LTLEKFGGGWGVWAERSALKVLSVVATARARLRRVLGGFMVLVSGG